MATWVGCQRCSASFQVPPGYPAKGRGKYCGRECSQAAHRRGPDMICFTCEVCAKVVTRPRNGKRLYRFCGLKCSGRGRSGPYVRRPDGEPFITRGGYRMVRVPGRRRAVLEHVLLAEQALGRPLRSGEVVHHVNGDRQDNSRGNLLICTAGYHWQLHARMADLYQREHFGRSN